MAPALIADQSVSWSNQDLVVYHGTVDTYVAPLTSRAASVFASKGPTDFGTGFYTTTRLRQAENWANKVSEGKPGAKPAVVQFVISREALGRLDVLMGEFNQQVNAALVDPEFIAGVRKKLALDQREAAEIFGGGVNAFSRYENGKTKPPLALVQLFKVLERHPELLAEIRAS